MPSYNKVILLGNMTRDPELSYTPNQTSVCQFGMAINRKWSGKDGQAKEEVCFVDCVAFSKSADTLNKYLHKGDPVLIEGRLQFDSWTAQDGTKRNKLKVVVEKFQFIGTKQEKPANTNPDYVGDNPPPPPDDDIPF